MSASPKKQRLVADKRAYERTIEKLIAHEGADAHWYNPLGGESDEYDMHDWFNNWRELPRTAGVRVGFNTRRNGKRELYVVKRPYRGAHYRVVLYLLGG